MFGTSNMTNLTNKTDEKLGLLQYLFGKTTNTCSAPSGCSLSEGERKGKGGQEGRRERKREGAGEGPGVQIQTKSLFMALMNSVFLNLLLKKKQR